MSLLTSIGTAFAIRSYIKTLKDYFNPIIKKTKKRLKNEYFKYDNNENGDVYFWRDALGNDFAHPTNKKIEKSQKIIQKGDMVELNDFNISRWVPLFPGKKYSKEGKEILDNHEKLFPKDHDFGLEEELAFRNDSLVLSGSATMRLLPFRDQYLLNSSGNWCATGIPIIISERIYEEKLQEDISKEGCVTAKIVGILTDLPWEWKDRIESSLLNKIEKNIYGLPRIVLKVNEIKNIGSRKECLAQAWTQFVNKEHNFSAYMSSVFYPYISEDIDKAINMVANYKHFLESSLIGGKWEIDIEFDETKNWFVPGKFQEYNMDEIKLFFMYYSNPWGRIVYDPKIEKE